MSKELENIRKTIGEYIKKYKGQAMVIVDICAFKGKECDVVDDRIFCFGVKESVLISLDELTKQIKKEKEDFINW